MSPKRGHLSIIDRITCVHCYRYRHSSIPNSNNVVKCSTVHVYNGMHRGIDYPTVPADVPGEPLEVNGVILGSYNSALISWLPPTFDGNCLITGYLLERRRLEYDVW